ncbi:MAG: EAL and HDOD domain-containing protein, partial [Kineothrix sp.]
PGQFTIEILESVVFTIEVIDALHTLKAAGFVIALDDYAGSSISPEVLDLIDIIKIDFQLTTREQRAAFAPGLIRAGKILLAEKVETKENVEEARALGCQLFQGYYFSKPVMMKKNRMDIASSSYVKLSREITQPTIDLDKVAYIINWDAHLTYKLLKRVKTLRYYRGNVINSIKQALVLMGEEEVRRWMMLVFIRGVLDSRSDERIRTGLIRAFMCEKLAQETRHAQLASPAFTTGIFSVLLYDSVSPEETFGDVEIPAIIKAALAGEDNILRSFLDITFCYENGDWEGLDQMLKKIRLELKHGELTNFYLHSVSAADELLAKDSH